MVRIMLEKIQLKINEKPLLRTYHYIAFPISIITACDEEKNCHGHLTDM